MIIRYDGAGICSTLLCATINDWRNLMKVTKARVERAVMIQFRKELKATQKGVLEILGGGSEATVAKYLKQIKDELPEREIALFSPDIPLELVPVLESIYHRALEASELALESERVRVNLVADEAMKLVESLRADLEVETKGKLDLEVRLIAQANKIEHLEQVSMNAVDALAKAQAEFDKSKELATLGRLKQKGEHAAELLEFQTNSNETISQLAVKVATMEAKYLAEKEQTIYERKRSDAETSRLFMQIDDLKIQNSKDKESSAASTKRLDAELHLSHAREDRLVLKLGALEEDIQLKQSMIEALDRKLANS